MKNNNSAPKIYEVYTSATEGHEINAVTVRPPLERGQVAVAKAALNTLMPGMSWRGISAPGETRFMLGGLDYDRLVVAGGTVIEAIRQDGFDVVPKGGVHITESGLLE